MTEFAQLGLSSQTLQAVAETGYTTATPIQEQAIPVALAGRDVLGIPQTGTGKTAAFTLPTIDRLSAGRSKARMPRALVLAPTRELASQIHAECVKFGASVKCTSVCLYGGAPIEAQQKALAKDNPNVVIATPGRLCDLLNRGSLTLGHVGFVVLDEADRMLDMGFEKQIEQVFGALPSARQTLCFTATVRVRFFN